ncbi:unnamed protein product [Arctogadus glacialis]
MELWSAVQRENPEPGLLLGLWFSRRSPFRRAAAQTLEPYDGDGPRSPVSSEGSGPRQVTVGPSRCPHSEVRSAWRLGAGDPIGGHFNVSSPINVSPKTSSGATPCL